ncbi:MAG: hypothetical protein ACU0CI_06745 [Shimia sp.]
MRFVSVIAAMVALAACSPEATLELAYPDRETFAFTDAEGEPYRYLCAPGPDAATRAAAAHRETLANIDAIAGRFADALLAGDGEPSLAETLAATRSVDAQAEAVVEQVEARYQCLLID